MGFYLLIAVILLLTIFALRGGSDARDPATYGQVPVSYTHLASSSPARRASSWRLTRAS